MATDNSPAAFPCPASPYERGIHSAKMGMTLRQYYAGLAMAAIVTRGGNSPEAIAHGATDIADALLKELEK